MKFLRVPNIFLKQDSAFVFIFCFFGGKDFELSLILYDDVVLPLLHCFEGEGAVSLESSLS